MATFFHIPPGMEEALNKSHKEPTSEEKRKSYEQAIQNVPAKDIVINGDTLVKEVEDDPKIPVGTLVTNDRPGILIDVFPATERPADK